MTDTDLTTALERDVARARSLIQQSDDFINGRYLRASGVTFDRTSPRYEPDECTETETSWIKL
ncbi:hypothetical protein HH308_06625 [Gordonia sp. TBRC 11910]|uniref:Uncharacterized protein n=1 Tax=Gordonia asplenii TaxID=2725283 RepID=A0A848KSC5_9ACTN|nr:hypothetical protein [Gordonia asplenii]NMO00887.1 hypothetical protein [Gordonia asplenii]